MEVVMKTVRAQERIEGGEVSEKMGLQDGTRQKSVCLIQEVRGLPERRGKGSEERMRESR